MVGNVYFELTEEFNAAGPTVLLASGQAVVYHRIAIMSKDGDWVVRETPDACRRVLEVLGCRGARYRPSAPLDVRWLAGGWSSHFEFFDERKRRIRCDFFSRPPRLPRAVIDGLFERGRGHPLAVVDVEPLILMKQTQRAKDYAVIGELSRLLPPERELALTTDPDRVLELAPRFGSAMDRPAVLAALAGERDPVVVALAREADRLQAEDRRRLRVYEDAAAEYLGRLRQDGLTEKPLAEAQERAVRLAESCLPRHPLPEDEADAAAQ
ncbi:MAG TPA: hypothetical protein VJU18_15100 [Vicinamibacteria bacterium]|nr:hypothetical protein [Vicinamibacteria bacterium]